MPRTEFSPIAFTRAQDIRSLYHGRKATVLGTAGVNIFKHSDGAWYVTGFLARAADPSSYIDMFGEVASREPVTPQNVAIANTLREAKAEAVAWINREVCMKSLSGMVMYDEGYDYEA